MLDTGEVKNRAELARRLGLEVGSVFVNDWAKVYDNTEEGGFKLSGLGRLNGHAALDDFIEYKHIALKPGLAGTAAGPVSLRSAL